ncbi:MAG: LPS export ABC transporter periplasmic protein LptC [Flavobacteriaceae bacterium]|nr:LPS export ABC transporter periplasmic protein LptC [Flavobacteriaceae bacterium]
MHKSFIYSLKISTFIFLIIFFSSCENNIQEVQDFLADKNLPVGVAKNINLIHTDSGRIKTRLITPLLHDYTNRELHPYQEFPTGIQIINFEKNGDSITLIADYGRSFTKTAISEVKGNVVIINHKDRSRLYTDQLYWDQNTHYIYTDSDFTLYKNKDTIKGRGFESNEDLTKWNARDISGTVYVNEND